MRIRFTRAQGRPGPDLLTLRLPHTQFRPLEFRSTHIETRPFSDPLTLGHEYRKLIETHRELIGNSSETHRAQIETSTIVAIIAGSADTRSASHLNRGESFSHWLEAKKRLHVSGGPRRLGQAEANTSAARRPRKKTRWCRRWRRRCRCWCMCWRRRWRMRWRRRCRCRRRA